MLKRFNSNIFFQKIKTSTVTKKSKNIACNNEFLFTSQSFETKVQGCQDFNCFLKRLKQHNSKNSTSNFSKNIKLQYETINFRFELLKHFRDAHFTIKPNLSFEQLQTIKQFKSEKPFIITECDKNIGSAIISRETYSTLASNLLNDDKIYEVIPFDPLQNCVNSISNSLSNLLKTNNISKKLYSVLLPKNCKLGSFRLLPKLHKNKFSCRPIINCRNHPSSNLALFLELILKPLVLNSFSYLKDSQNLIQTTHSLTLPHDAFLHSCDFESLYTNINSHQCIELLTNYVNVNIKCEHFSSLAFKNILELSLFNNYFVFDYTYFLQKSGIPMGIICGPTLANLFLSILEEKWLVIHRPIFYKRYIDDIFIISTFKLNSTHFQNFFSNLQLNIVIENEVNFLDLLISIDKITNKLNFNLYIKPTNTFSYLQTNSNHPDHIFKNIPKSQFKRIRRICSSILDYFYNSRRLIFNLESRGYNYRDLTKCMNIVANINRDSLIQYKDKSNQSDFSNTLLFNYFDLSFPNLSNIVTKSWRLGNADTYFRYNRLKFIFLMQNNIQNTLIFNFNSCNQTFKQNKKCSDLNCKICNFLIIDNFYIFNNFKLPIIDMSTCTSSHVIYIIICLKCHIFYIGETCRTARQRIYEHLNSIKLYKTFKIKETEVSKHFSAEDHDISEHFRFAILRNNIVDKFIRRDLEADLIHVFDTFKINILNEKIQTRCFIKHMFFNI